jgi:hypothetical protein
VIAIAGIEITKAKIVLAAKTRVAVILFGLLLIMLSARF